MSETIDLQLLGKMVARLQTGVDNVRQDYASVRATLTAMDSRSAEFNLRLSSLELAQMKLAVSVDDAHTKLDRLERDVETMAVDLAGVKADLSRVKADVAGVKAAVAGLKSELGEMKADLTGLKSELAEVKADLTEVKNRQTGMDGKLDLIVARLAAA